MLCYNPASNNKNKSYPECILIEKDLHCNFDAEFNTFGKRVLEKGM